MKTNQKSIRRSVLTLNTLLLLALVMLLSSAQNALAQQQNLTRTLPLSVNNEVDIGSFAFTNGGGSLWISVTVPSGGYSVAKEYLLPIQYNQNINIWQAVLPASSTGSYSGNDFALDVRINGGTASLRLRTTASDGANVGTAYVSIKQEGVTGDAFTSSTSTSAVSAPTTFFSSTVLTQVSGNVGIGTVTPGFKLDLQGGSLNSSGGLCIAGDCKTAWSQVGSQWTTSSSNIYYNAGNVGIGTSNPYAKFVVTGGADTSLAIGDRTTSGSIGLQFMGSGYKHAGLRFDGDNLILENASASTTPSTWYSANPMNFIVRYGNVGIGTTAPGYKLDVQGGPLNSSGGLCIAGDCKTGWSQVSTQWTTAGSNIHYPSGNVGVGVTAPVLKLDIGGLGSAVGFFPGNTSSLGPNAVLNRIVARSNYGAVDTTSAAEIKFLTGNAVWYKGQIAFYTNDYDSTQGGNTLERMRITSPGNVGIGTTNPSEKLEVSGNIKVAGTGNIDASGTITAGNIVAKYQDVAEWVQSSQELSGGTVVVLDHTRSNQVIASSQAYDTRVAGVISLQPGITLGENGTGKVLVATTGRVMIKVDASRGAIQVGDLLVTSDMLGVAMKSQPIDVGGARIHRPGTLLGKALEPLAQGTGEILVLLSLQ